MNGPKSKKNPRGVYEKVPGSGVWYIRWQNEHGIIKRQKVGSRAAAIVAVEQKRAKVRLRHVAPELLAEPRKDMLLADLLDFRVRTSGNQKSAREEQRHARDWKEWFPGAKVRKLTTADLEEWLAVRRTEVKPATVNRSLAFLSACYKVAVREGWADRNPVAGLFLKENNKRSGFLELEDFFRMMDLVDPEPFSLIEFAILSGVRQDDQFSMRKDQLGLARKGVWLPDPKSGERKWTRLNSRCVEILEYWCNKTPKSEWVFQGRRARKGVLGHLDAKHFAESVLYPALRQLGLPVGIEGLTWHSLRHTFATWLGDAGEDLSVIQDLMDHSNQRTTERYRHRTRTPADRAVDKLEQMAHRPGRSHLRIAK